MGDFNMPLLVSPPDSEMDIIKKILDIQRKQRFRAVLCNSLWALFSASYLGGLSAYNLFGPRTNRQQCSESETCYEVPCAAAYEFTAIVYGLLCCSVLQAAAAVLALLLADGRRRRALAYAVLAATTAGHCMHGRIHYLLLAYPGHDGVWLAVLHLATDLLCFFLLIVQERDDDEYER